MELGPILEQLRHAIGGLFPILGAMDLRRRATRADEGGHANVWRTLLGRTLASALVAMVLGVSSGAFSAYIMVRVMDSQITAMIAHMDRLEGRFNHLTDDFYRRNNR